MDFVKLKKMKKIVSNTGIRLACVGIEICDELKLKSIILHISYKYDNLLLENTDLDKITKYIINNNNQREITLNVIDNSIKKVMNYISEENIKTLSKRL